MTVALKSEPVKIVLGILLQQNLVLLSQRQEGQSHAGKLEFPGGKIEPGEQAIEALKREFMEEVGLQTFNWQLLDEFEWQYGTRHLAFKVFMSHQFSGEPQSCEGQKVFWQAINELEATQFPEANGHLIQTLKTMSLTTDAL